MGDPRRLESPSSDGPSSTVPLRAYRLAPRKPRLELSGAVIAVRFPSYFGERRWRLDAADTVAASLATPPRVTASASVERATVFADEPDLEFLSATNSLVSPNLVLLFRRPQKVPPTRWITALGDGFLWGPVQTRRPDGPQLDGLLLRCVDPTRALATLEMHGTETTTDPDAWLRARRAVLELDAPASAERFKISHRLRRNLRLSDAMTTIAGVTVVAVPVLHVRGNAGDWLVGAGAAVIALNLAGRRVAVKRAVSAFEDTKRTAVPLATTEAHEVLD